MINELFTKCFFTKPTTYCGNKSLVLNFDNDAENFTVIPLNNYSSYKFYIKKGDDRKYILIFDGVLLSGENKILSFNFDDEDDAEKAIQQVLVSLHGKTKVVGKFALNIVFILVILFGIMTLARSIMGFIAPIEQVSAQQSNLQVPPFAMNGNGQIQGQGNWGLSTQQQEAMAKANEQALSLASAGSPKEINQQYQLDLAKKLAEANSLMDGNINAMRENRDSLVEGGNPYAQNTNQAASVQPQEQQSSGAALINALQGK